MIKDFLIKEYHIPDYEADVCVSFAQGNVGKAIQLISSEDFNEMKNSVLQIVKKIDDTEVYDFSSVIKEISEYKSSIQDYLDLLCVWYRDVLYYKSTNDTKAIIFKDEAFEIKKQSAKYTYNGIEKILEGIEQARIRLSANVNFELVIELLLLTIKEN